MLPHGEAAEQRLFVQLNAPWVAFDNKEAKVSKLLGVNPRPEKLVEKIEPF
jgi:hypothetical protein